MQKNDLTANDVLQLLRYDSDTGKLFWVSCRYQNFIGKEAGVVRKHGYRVIIINGFQYLAHRLSWLVCFGVWPSGNIDHIDGNRLNNRIANLRIATHGQNIQNQHKAHARNKSGLLGVSWCKSHKKWRASIMVNGKPHNLGRHNSKEFAHQVYLEAKARLHPFQTISGAQI